MRAAQSGGLSGAQNSAEELRKAGESVKKAASAALGSAADAVKNMKVCSARIAAELFWMLHTILGGTSFLGA